MAASLPSMVYRPLADPKQQIRLLRLKPCDELVEDAQNRLLRCQLTHVDVDSNPEYTALSYTWGTSSSTLEVEIDGTKAIIGENLYDFLAETSKQRKVCENTYFWIDQICINQTDVIEKSHQVQQMASIYKSASEVVIWLDKGSHESDLAMQWMLDGGQYQWPIILRGAIAHYTSKHWPLWSKAEIDVSKRYWIEEDGVNIQEQEIAANEFREFMIEDGLSRGAKRPEKRADNAMKYMVDRARFAKEILDRPYWQRLWIIQEIILAGSLYIMLGSACVPWEAFEDCMHLDEIQQPSPRENRWTTLEAMNNEIVQREVHYDIHRLISLRKSGQVGMWTWADVVDMAKSALCSNLRDRFFGMLGLVYEEVLITPDYTTTPSGLALQIIVEESRFLCGEDIMVTGNLPLDHHFLPFVETVFKVLEVEGSLRSYLDLLDNAIGKVGPAET